MIVSGFYRLLLRIAAVALVVVLIPVVIVVFIVSIPWILVSSFYETLDFRRFRRRHAGRNYLVWSSRHGWRNFIVNNVIPALPRGTQAFRLCSIRDTAEEERALRTYLYSRNHSRPYLACVRADKITFVPLHYALLPHRSRAARDENVQRITAKVVHHAIQAGQFG
ncbi:MAG: hypothetical protein DWQ34_18170 [Planctomycetota bacterium]|nr:MAG: hypothetical protein DWQ29_09845 [Planctomycetota bacterium]REJ90111.1 MAG: hypothetical protein DWQ34_18170 [Planctomycetota bacterium]REK21047.1 MAG: hypothetical protein DWQ41_22890 [Planctomycetota bacterium]REK38864.1 MAG: hypothetical protein DWQ45_03185 [Planctomycetota bacterium]